MATTKNASEICKAIERSKNNPRRPNNRAMRIYRMVEVQGMSQAMVAKLIYKETGKRICQQRISQIVNRVRPWVVGQLLTDVLAIRHQQHQRLEYVYSQAQRAWQKSKKDAQSSKRKVKASQSEIETHLEYGDVLTDQEIEEVRKGQCGDPRFLAEMRAALAAICDLWGVKHISAITAGMNINVAAGGGVIVHLPDNGRDPDLPKGYQMPGSKIKTLDVK